MDRSGNLIKACTLLLIIVQLCLPLSGQVFLFGHGSPPAVATCTHADAAADHGTHHDQEPIPHCHELETPGVTGAGPVVMFAPVAARLTAIYCGTLLPGHGDPIDIPPELLTSLS